MSDQQGSWSLQAGIRRQWNAEKLDEHFLTRWPHAKRGDYLALSDSEVEGAAPLPYCVYTAMPAVRVTGTGGKTAATQICTYNASAQFNIHAESKPEAALLAQRIVAAFGPDKRLDLAPAAWVQTWLQSEFGVKESDKHYLWVLEFVFQFEATYALPPPPSGA